MAPSELSSFLLTVHTAMEMIFFREKNCGETAQMLLLISEGQTSEVCG